VPYEEMIKNIRKYLNEEADKGISQRTINAFTISSVLAIALDKTKEEVLEDIINTL